MKSLPENIKFKFFNILLEKQSVLDFEQWVYESKDLEEAVDEDSYLDFISLDYNANGAYYELKKLIEKQIDKLEFLNWKLITELEQVKLREGNYLRSIISFYDLYCKGYGFLDNLAFGYGLPLDCIDYSTVRRDQIKIKKEKQERIADGFYPVIITEVEKVINWIKKGEIVLKESNDEFGQLAYLDYRLEEDRLPTTYSMSETGSTKKWWQLWK